MSNTAWRTTDLSTDPPGFVVADTDRWPLRITGVPEGTVDAEADIVRMDTPDTKLTDLIDSTTFDAMTSTITVVVSGFVRRVTYELSIVAIKGDGMRETATTAIACVA